MEIIAYLYALNALTGSKFQDKIIDVFVGTMDLSSKLNK